MSAVPLCFVDPNIFKLWSGSAKVEECGEAGPCRDCLPAYQLRMKKRGRCSHPETMFGISQDGGVYGFWPT